MASREALLPFAAELPTANFPQLLVVNNRPCLAFDASTRESAIFTVPVPQGITGTPSLTCFFIMASATTGGIAFDIDVEAVASGDALDLDASTSFDTVNTGTANVPATAGNMATCAVTLTNADGMVAGDYARFRITRATDNASDTATGDLYFLLGEIRDSA